MTRLSWDALGERYYETGVDRGVLFVDNVGAAWSGLISVQEKPSGGDPTPHYIDGYKYVNVAASEEYEATIEAYSSPDIFAPCDGFVQTLNGLIVTAQPRKPFNFSYRTLVGNDVDAEEVGYKLHMVYNALASPSERNNTTIQASANPTTLSWDITTCPPYQATGYKMTAHYIIDSRRVDPGMMAYFETFLYGNESADPYFATPIELIGFFG